MIGVVVIGRNEGERLVRCLQSLQGLRSPIVYVDSASTDGSVEAAADFGALVVLLDRRQPLTAARARAEGFAALDRVHPGLTYVLFVDGDCEVEAGFCEGALAFVTAHPDVAAVCGRRRERNPEGSLFNGLIDREWATPVGDAMACGGDALFRISAYRTVGGFNPRMLAGEEPELCGRLRLAGWRIVRLDLPMTVHDAAMYQFSQWWRRAIRSGMGYAQAWRASKGRPGPRLYHREILRAMLWAGVLPLTAILLGWLLHPALISVWPGLVSFQVLRLTIREGTFAALLSVIGKYAELTGVILYIKSVLRGDSRDAVLYK